uniref:Uncharacterized protein n=1 Tax=Arundo donax TaxID=35708 RepID=A0A0A9E4V3_ARUDO
MFQCNVGDMHAFFVKIILLEAYRWKTIAGAQ